MTATVFILVLCAAALHAGWNVVVKSAGDTFVTAVAICFSAALVAALVLPFIAQPAAASWPYLGASMLLQTAYYALVAAAYQRADMSLVYPLMRGTAPMMVAVISALALGEVLPLAGWVGVGLISGGILSMALFGHGGRRDGMGLALLNAVVIATYTLNDGWGARASGAPVSYSLWVSLLTAPPVLIWALVQRGPAIMPAVASRWRTGLIGAVGSMTSYAVALWAMTRAPVALVAALRETSILFATIISVLVLGEKVGKGRILAVAIIVAGAAALRLA